MKQIRGPQSPDLGEISKYLGPFKVTGNFWYRIQYLGVWYIPNWIINILLFLFTIFFLLLLRKIGKSVSSNLKVIQGNCNWLENKKRIFRTFSEYAWCSRERYENFARKIDFHFKTDNFSAWELCNKSSKGFIILTAHIGNWEIGSTQIFSLGNRHIHVAREKENDSKAQFFIESLLQKRMGDNYTTHFESNDLRLGLILLEALKEGDLVALQGDRPRIGEKSVLGNLFNRNFHYPSGPFILSRLGQVPILPVFIIREKRFQYKAVLFNPLFVSNTQDKENDISNGVHTFSIYLEKIIKKYPNQWFCFNNIWPSS